MKPLLALLVTLPLFSLAQVASTGHPLSGDTLYTLSGYKVVRGEKLTIGAGSMPGGIFRYIRVSSYSLFRRAGKKGVGREENAFYPAYKGLQFEVVRIDRRGNDKQTYDYFPIISAGIVRYQVDINNAIASGEIVIPEEYKLKTAASKTPAIGRGRD